MKIPTRTMLVATFVVLAVAAILCWIMSQPRTNGVAYVEAPNRVDQPQPDIIYPKTASALLSQRVVSRGGPSPTYRDTQAANANSPNVADLARRLHDESDAGKAAILAQQLAAIGSPDAIAALLDVLRQTDDLNRKSAIASAFQRLDNPDASPAVINGLVQISDDYITLAALRECAPRLMNTNGLAILLSALEQPLPNDWQRSNLLGYLSEVRNPDTADLLADAVWTVTNADVREQAVVALAEIGDNTTFSYLLDFLSDQSMSNTHEHILYMIGQIQNKEAASNLATAFLSSTNEGLRYAAARALATIQDSAKPEPALERNSENDSIELLPQRR